MGREDLYRRINEGILEERFAAFERNLAKNIPLIRSHGGLQRVLPMLAGMHVVVVGAGPSLNGAVDLLKKFQHRENIRIIASDMALLPLARGGVRPAFAITCETTPVDFFAECPSGAAHLLAFSCASNINLRRWRGDISFYNWMLRGEPYDGLWRTAGEELGFVATGSIVTTQAVSLALGCGIASLALVGNDMGFSRSFYARNTLAHRRLVAGGCRFSPPETIEFGSVWRARQYVIHREGRSYFTNGQFLAARTWLEDLFGRQSVPIYDASEPGCDRKSVRKTGLEVYLETAGRRAGGRR